MRDDNEAQPESKGGSFLMTAKQPDTWVPVASVNAPQPAIVPRFGGDFPDEWKYMIGDLVDLWSAKFARNCLKMRYYSGRNVLKDFGISIPPQLLNVETIVGWPQKAVDAMAVRCRFDGFAANNAEVQAMLDALKVRSRLRVKYRQAVQSTLIHSCCFATVTMDENGKSRIDFYSAERAASRWDDAKGRIAYGFVIDEFENGQPCELTLYTDDAAVHVWKTNNNWWSWEAQPYSMGRPTMEAFAYRPTFRKPFGQSRINRAVMSITDSAVREALRTEISAEFFTSPQKYLLGADKNAFENKTKWEAYIGNIFAVGRDEDGNTPQFGQLSQGSMQPHTDYMRALAARFSGETNIPISTLGVVHDQPASAEAIYAASEPLIIECEDFNDSARESLKTLALMAIAGELDKPLDELPVEYADFIPDMRDPAMPSVVSQTDAMIKIASVVPGFAGTDVFFEQIGFAEDVRKRAENEIRRNAASFSLAGVLNSERMQNIASEAARNVQSSEETPTVDDTAAVPVEDARTLNGAQTQSLLTVIQNWQNGALTEGQAIKVISLSCGISEDDAKSILEGR